MAFFRAMMAISITQLHARTGYWVRRAKKQPIIVTDRGEKIARLQAYIPDEPARPVFARRDRP